MALIVQLCVCCLLWTGSVLGLTFGERLHELKAGDEIVYDFQRSVTVLRVLKTSGTVINLQVATATRDVAEREGFSSWLAWANSGCPGAATNETLELQVGEHPTVLSRDAKEAEWLVTLLGLAPSRISDQARKKAGPTPMPEEIDLRKPWQPRIMVDGHNVGGVSDAYSFHWPNDTGPLSDRTIIAYFPRSTTTVPALPYWIESPSSSAYVGVLDSHRDENS